MVFVVFFHQQLIGDPEQQHAADDLQERQRQQLHDDEHEKDAEGDGRAGAEADAPFALMFRQITTGERDDHRIVAGEQEIDPDDFQNGKNRLGQISIHHDVIGLLKSRINSKMTASAVCSMAPTPPDRRRIGGT